MDGHGRKGGVPKATRAREVNMKVNHVVVNLNSEEPEALIRFYEEVVGMEPRSDIGPGAFAAGGEFALIIEAHANVRGQAKEPARVLLNLMVDDAASEQRRLEAAGVPVVRPLYEEPGVGMFATFSDPDGNLLQLVELRG
jgi:predicted enzyme related to lactoylglutathione lyase